MKHNRSQYIATAEKVERHARKLARAFRINGREYGRRNALAGKLRARGVVIESTP